MADKASGRATEQPSLLEDTDRTAPEPEAGDPTTNVAADAKGTTPPDPPAAQGQYTAPLLGVDDQQNAATSGGSATGSLEGDTSKSANPPHARQPADAPGPGPGGGGTTREPARRPNVADDYTLQASVSSALWAAWADAAGFITELTNIAGVNRRLRTKRSVPDGSPFEQLSALLNEPLQQWPVQGTVEWTRRVGGRSGVEMALPAGTYSDDTQLRLATSRCISEGTYDPVTFALIELPAFTCYGLGGGAATKGGATAMSKPNTSWAAPGHPSWVNAGGNGVVMRVAPLAYAATAYGTSLRDLAIDVIRNGVVTHGHPRGLLPACLHALVLTETLRHHSLAPLHVVHHWLEELRAVPAFMAEDPELGSQTLPAFDKESKRPFDVLWQETVMEMHELLERFDAESRQMRVVDGYLTAAREVGLFKPGTRGSGTACFAAAYWLAHTFRRDPMRGVLLAVNAVGTDTDTIATIAGAHLGVENPFELRMPLMDREYIEAETRRVVAPSHRLAAQPIRHPELDGWRPPRAQADYVGIDANSGRVAVAGLGAGEWLSPPVNNDNPEFVWQWLLTDFGQSLPVKRRTRLPVLPVGALPPVPVQGQAGQPTVGESKELDEIRARMERANAAVKRKGKYAGSEITGRPHHDSEPPADDFAAASQRSASENSPEKSREKDSREVWSLDKALDVAHAQHFDDEVVGRLARLLATKDSSDAALAFFGNALAYWRAGRR